MRPPSKAATFWILIALSAISVFVLPGAWTRLGRGPFQTLAFLKWPATWFAHQVGDAVEAAAPEKVPSEKARDLRLENERLQRQVLQQRLLLQAAERQLEEVTRIAGQMPDAHAGVVVAPVVACDADPRHATLLIAKGQQKRWVTEGEWVVAAGGAAPEWDAEATVRDLLARGWIIGRISEVHPNVARVRLTTDPRFETEAWLARTLADGTVQMAPDPCVLNGQGRGQMRISQARADYFRSGHIIVLVPESQGLPAPMTVGRVTSAAARGDSAQHFDLQVVPWGPAEKLTHVYVIVTER